MKLSDKTLYTALKGKFLVAKTFGIATVLGISAILFFVVFIKLGALSTSKADLDVFLNGERLDVVSLNKSAYLPNDIIEVDTGKVPSTAVNVSLLDPKGREVAATLVDIEDGKDSTARLTTTGDMVPGKYQLKIKSKIRENEEKQVDFRWGVLALNVDKSSYKTADNISFSLGSLDDKGNTLCDSNLQLSVTSPSGALITFNTTDESITKNPSCGPNNVTDLPDYSAGYSDLKEEGEYTVSLKNLDNDYEIKSKISVNNATKFFVERKGATRINPFLSKYKMYLSVEAFEDFSGLIVENVPVGFEISKSAQYVVQKNTDGTSHIVWQRTLNSGDKESLTYEYQAPKISPEFFLLGSVTLTDLNNDEPVFEEIRQWQLASDATSTIATSSSVLGSIYPAQRRIVRTTNGTNGKRTFSIAWSSTGPSLNLYYTDDPDAGSPTWSLVGTLRGTSSHIVADMVWDDVNNSLYIVYGRNTRAGAAEVDFNRVSSLNGASCNDTASNCDISNPRDATAVATSGSEDYTHPQVEIGYDSGTRKVFVFASAHDTATSAAPSKIVVRTGTINSDAPTWDTIYTVKSWTANANSGMLGVTRSNNDRLILQYYDGTNILATRHDDATDAQATSGWDALDSTDNSQTTISGDDPGARGAGSVSGATNSTAVWFSWLDSSSDINTRRWSGSALDTEMTPIAAGANTIGPALTTNDSTLYMVYQDESDATKMVYQSRSFTDGTTAWNGTETTLEDHTETLSYPSVAARTNQSKLDVIYTTATTFLVRQTSVSVTALYNVSGVAYVDEAGALWTGAGKCDGSTNSISISVNGGTKQSTTCNGTTAAFSLDVTAPSAANQIITVFMDTNGGDKGVSYIKNNDTTTSISNVILFKNHIFLQSESAQSLANSNFTYDSVDDSDIPATISGSNLTGATGVELYINDSDTYAPGGNVTVDYMDVDGAYSGGSETLEIFGTGTGTSCGDPIGSGRPLCFRGGTGFSFTAPTTVNFTGTAATVLEAGTFTNLGVGTTSDSSAGATFTLWNDITVTGTLTVGNASSTNTDTLNGGAAIDYIIFEGSGTVFNITSKGLYVANTSHVIYDASSGSTTIAGTTYNDLYIDASTDVGAGLTYTLGGNVTVTGNLYLGHNTSTNTDTLNGSSYTLTFTGSTSPFNIRSKGTFVAATSTVNYTGSSATAIATTDYYNLGVGTTSDVAAAVTYTLGGTLTVSGVLTVGNASSTNTDIFDGGAGSNFITFTGTGTVFNITSKGSYVANASQIIYDSTGNATIAGTTYNDLYIDSVDDVTAGGTYTLGGNTTVGGTLYLGGSGSTNTDTLDGSSYTLTFTGSGTPFGIRTKGSFTASTSTVNYTGSSATALAVTTYYNLGVGTTSDVATAVTYTLGGNTTVSNVLTVGNASSTNTDVLAGSTYTLTLSGSGTPFVITSKGSYTVNTSTVNYIGSSATALATTTYYNLGVGTTSDVAAAVTYTLGGNTTVTNVLTVGNASSTNTDILSASSFTLTLSGSGTPFVITSKGSLTAGTSTVTYLGTSATALAIATYYNLGVGTTSDVAAAVTYTLGGNTTVSNVLTVGNASSTNTDVLAGSTYTLTLSGSGTPFVITSKGSYTVGTSTVNFTGGTTTINALSYYNLGVGTTSDATAAVTYTLGGNTTVTNVLTVGNASSTNTDILAASTFTLTLSGSGTPFVLTSKGSFTANTSTVSYLGSSATALAIATYYNLGVGTTSDVAAAVTYTLGGNTTVSNVLTIGNASSTNSDVLSASSFTLTLSGSGTPFVITSKGTFTSSTSTVVYTGGSATNVSAATYYNLEAKPGANSVTHTFATGTTTVSNNFTAGNGTNTSVTITAATNSTTLDINGSMTISTNTTFTAHSSNSFTIAGSFTNNGTFTANSGTITFDTAATATITGTTTFNNFSSTVAGKTIKFQKQTTNTPIFTFAGTLTLTGGVGSLINLESDTAATQWLAHFNSTQSAVTYVNIKDSGCDVGSASVTYSATNTNGGNNGSCWGMGITVSGFAYSDEAGSPTVWSGAGKCDGSSAVISLSINGGTKQSTTCNGTTGAFSFEVSAPGAANQVIALFLDTNGGDKGVLYTKNNDTTSNITGLKLTKNRIWIQSESSQSISNANINVYDVGGAAGDNDIPANSNGTNLTVDTGVELHINTGDTYIPGGNVTVDNIDLKGIYTGSTDTLTLTGSGTGGCSTNPGTIRPLCIDGGTFTAPTNVNYTGTSGNSTIEGTSYTNLGAGTTLDSSTGRTFTLGGNTTVTGTITIGNASSTNTDIFDNGSYSLTLTGTTPWTITAKGQLAATGGTVTFTAPATIPVATYNNLNLNPSSDNTTYTLAAGTITVNGNLSVGNGSNTGISLDANTNSVDIDVSGTVTINTSSSLVAKTGNTISVGGGWVNNGTFTNNSGTIVFDSTSGGNTISGNLTGSNKFNNVTFNGSGGSWSINSNTDIAGSFNLTNGNLTQGANIDIFSTGNITLAEGTTFTKASGTGKFKMDGPTGTQTFTDNHSSKVNLGHVQVGASPGTTTLASDMLATDLTIPTLDTFNTKGYDVTVTDFFDCQGTCVLDTTDTAPNNEGDGTRITVGGNWTMSSSGTFTSTSSTVEFNGAANQTISTGGKSFNNLTVNNSGTTNDDAIISGNLTVGGNVLISDGELKLSTNNPVTDLNGNLTISSGAVLTASSSAAFTLAGNWTNSGTFTHNSGTITLDSATTATLTGATTFNNFTSTTAGKTIKFQKHTANVPVFTFAGTVTITGASGNKINIQSDTAASQWLAHFNTAQSGITYVDIKDSGCDAGTSSVSESGTNTSSGNNSYCWSAEKPTFAEASWYNSSWNKRKKITIDETKIPGSTNLTNFPVLVSRTDTELRDNAQSDGDDILFTSFDGKTKLSHEIEKYVSASGELIAWVKIPTLKAMVNSEIYMYYDNSSASNQQSPTTVWSSNYKAVYHMKETPTGTSGDIKDSTSTYNGTSVNMISGDQVTGKIDGALGFDSINNYVNTGLNSYYTNYTFEAWVKWDSCGENNLGRIFAKHQGSGQTMLLYCDSSYGGRSIDFQRVYSGSTAEWYVGASDLPAFGTVIHVAVTYSDGAANDPIIYINGVAKPLVEATSPSGTVTNNSDNYLIGNRSDETRTWDGYIDEFRISDSLRSADWIGAQYNNQDSPSTFYTVASQETKPVTLPTPILQKKVTGGTTIANYGWTNETQVQFVVKASDTSSSDTLYLCIEKDTIATAFSNTEDSCGSGVAYSGSAIDVTHTITGLTDTAQYHWQARVKDATGNYSDWVEYNAGSEVVVAKDTFTRSSVDTWRNADIGGGYTLGSSASHFDTNGTEGTIDVDFDDTQYFTSLQNVSIQNSDSLVKVKIDKVPSGSYGAAYIRARYGSSTGYYRARLKFNNTGSSVHVLGQQFTNSGGAVVDISSETQVSGLSYSANGYIWMRAQFTGISPTTIKIKAWADGTSEPSTWTYTATDSTAVLQTSGAMGLMARLNTGVTNYPVVFTYDDFSVTTTDETRDYGIDTTVPSTAGVTVYDGTTTGSDNDQNVTGSLSALSANWTTFNTNVSGLDKYQYSIGTTAGGTDTQAWTDLDTTTSFTSGSLTLHTAQPYFFNVRAVDNAGNTSSVVSSNGQYVTPTLTFSLSSNSITFTNLSVSNDNTDIKTTSVTTSTNAYNGYQIKAYRTALMSDGTNTIPDFSAGTYASPALWPSTQCSGSSCGYGYTSSDTTINGSNIFSGATKYAPFAPTGAGDVVADHTQSVTGTAVSNESFTITNKVAVPASQPAGTYTTTIVYTVVPQY
jgi:hypothetical protein